MTYRPEIDGLRALAVLSVVLYHAGLPSFSGGYVGVDIFFVISGFLITGIIFRELKDGSFSLARFYERRCRRIMPPLVVMALAVTLWSWLWLMPIDFYNFGRSLAAMASFWINIFLYKSVNYFDANSYTKPLLHTWSLSVEEQFYIIFPILLLLIFKLLKGREAGYKILASLAAIALASLAMSAVAIQSRPSAVFYFLQYRAWELLLGSLLAIGPPCPRLKSPAVTLLSLLSLALMLGPAILYDHLTVFPGPAALAPCLGAGLFIFIHGPGLENSPVGRLMATAVPMALGKISYSLYLWHWPLLTLPRYVLGQTLALWENMLLAGLAVLLSVLSWRFVEQPVRKKQIFLKRSRIFGATAAAIIILVLAGRGIKMADGFPGRLRPEARLYTQTALYLSGSFGHRSITPRDLGFEIDLPSGAAGLLLGSEREGSPDFLLLGDSHAEQWAGGFDRLAGEYDLKGLFIPTYGLPLPSTWDICRDNFRNHSLAPALDMALEIVRRDHIRQVIISGFYQRALGEANDLLDAHGQPRVCLSDDWREKSRAEARDIFARSFQSLTKELNELGATVWIINSGPFFGQSVPNMLARAATFGQPVEEQGYSLAENRRQNLFIDQVFAGLASPDVRVVEVAPVLCPDGWCLAGNEQGTFYFDSNHLSSLGVDFAQSILRTIMEGMISGPADKHRPPGGSGP